MQGRLYGNGGAAINLSAPDNRPPEVKEAVSFTWLIQTSSRSFGLRLCPQPQGYTAGVNVGMVAKGPFPPALPFGVRLANHASLSPVVPDSAQRLRAKTLVVSMQRPSSSSSPSWTCWTPLHPCGLFCSPRRQQIAAE